MSVVCDPIGFGIQDQEVDGGAVLVWHGYISGKEAESYGLGYFKGIIAACSGKSFAVEDQSVSSSAGFDDAVECAGDIYVAQIVTFSVDDQSPNATMSSCISYASFRSSDTWMASISSPVS